MVAGFRRKPATITFFLSHRVIPDEQ